ncbi:hypothetical protein FRC02_006708 [Tulasnella sp. 418]|nr:hypothetical protein FRC02_006708 [Tulasnella sp. 418]
MENHLAAQVIGQPEAVSAVANAIRLSRSGLSNAGRPIASLLFAGPSGTGKTLLSKTLASFMFDSPDAMIRIDGSEYSEPHAISRLVGAPPGYQGSDEGGQLTDYVRRKPFCIVLVDEIEKAAKELTTLFLQVLDDGRLTDSHGRVVDFKNTVIIMTSNVGASHLTGINPDDPVPPNVQERVMGSMREHFLPEFINRIDEIVVFRPLSRRNMDAIVNNRLKEVQDRLAPKKITLELDESARIYLSRVGYSAEYGARPLNRVIQKQLLQPLSQLLIKELVSEGETCIAQLDPSTNSLIVRAKSKSGDTPQTKEYSPNDMPDWGHGLA